MERNLRLFTPLYCLRWAGIYVVYLIPFLVDLQLSESNALWLISLTVVTAGVLEIPTGYFADSVGRRFSLVSGSAAATVGSVLYATATGEKWQLILAAVLYGVSNSLLSGADNAIVYETYVSLGRERDAHAADRRLRGWAGGSEAFFALFGIVVYWGFGYRGIMWAQVLLSAAVLVIAACLHEPRHSSKKTQVHIGFWAIVRRNVFNRQRLVVLLLAAFAANLSAALVWLTPVYYQYATGLSIGKVGEGWLYNVIWASFLLTMMLFSRIGDRFERQLEVRRYGSLKFLIGLAAVSYSIVVFGSGLPAVMAIALTYVVRAIAPPLATQIINERVNTSERATAQSIGRTLQWVIFGIVLALSGWAADAAGSIPVGIALSGVIMVGGAVSLLLAANRLGQLSPVQHSLT